jgi:hypothetical protein
MVGRAWKEDCWICGQQNGGLWWSCCSKSWVKKNGGATYFLTSSQQFLLCEPLPWPFLGHIIIMKP